VKRAPLPFSARLDEFFLMAATAGEFARVSRTSPASSTKTLSVQVKFIVLSLRRCAPVAMGAPTSVGNIPDNLHQINIGLGWLGAGLLQLNALRRSKVVQCQAGRSSVDASAAASGTRLAGASMNRAQRLRQICGSDCMLNCRHLISLRSFPPLAARS